MSEYVWDDFPASAEPADILDDEPRQRIVSIAGTRYLEMPDNGYQLLLAWVAGPGRVVRRADTAEHRVTVVQRAMGNRPAQTAIVPRSAEDWETVDSVVNGYLYDAGVPPRPRGFTFYLELPTQLAADDVWNAVARRTTAAEHPSEIRDGMTAAVADLYS